MNHRAKCRSLILAALAGLATTAFSQGGPLTPPAGAPAPTMKTLDQVEPRIPLVAGAPGVTVAASGQITISQSGSYYLTRNVEIASDADGIRINANGVTVDLMGYSIIYNGTGTAGEAIDILGSNITVQNGHILSTTTHDGSSFTAGGYGWGVYAISARENVTVRNLSVRGVRGTGIYLNGPSCLVENCTVTIAALRGIYNNLGIVRNVVVRNCGNIGIQAASAVNCKVSAAVATGISAEIVENCSAASTGLTTSGIVAAVVTNSVGISSGYQGIYATRSVTGSYGESTNTASDGYGIYVSGGTVSASRGQAAGGHGIHAGTVSSSYGASTGANGASSCGIYGETVSDSNGYASNATGGGHGISAAGAVTGSYGQSTNTASGRYGIYNTVGTVASSRGQAAGGHGIYAYTVSSSYGASTGANGANSCGIYGVTRVDHSSGYASISGGGHGIRSTLVSNSYGYAVTDALNGIDATLVSHSYGARGAVKTGQYGIRAPRGVGCYISNGDGVDMKFDM